MPLWFVGRDLCVPPPVCTIPYAECRLIPPRRRAALPATTGVGAGIPDGPGWDAAWARQGCHALRTWTDCPALFVGRVRHRTRYDIRPPSATRFGVGTAAFGFAGDCAICGWRLGTTGEFAPCAARVFRWLRPAGISPAAAGDRGFAPGPHNFFEKKLSKSFRFVSTDLPAAWRLPPS